MKWAILAEASGAEGAVKLAWAAPIEADANALADARAKASGQYRMIYGAWAARLDAKCAPVANRIFSHLSTPTPDPEGGSDVQRPARAARRL